MYREVRGDSVLLPMLETTEKEVVFKFDMNKVYPSCVGIINLNREIKFNRGSNAIIKDKFKLNDEGEVIEN